VFSIKLTKGLFLKCLSPVNRWVWSST